MEVGQVPCIQCSAEGTHGRGVKSSGDNITKYDFENQLNHLLTFPCFSKQEP